MTDSSIVELGGIAERIPRKNRGAAVRWSRCGRRWSVERGCSPYFADGRDRRWRNETAVAAAAADGQLWGRSTPAGEQAPCCSRAEGHRRLSARCPDGRAERGGSPPGSAVPPACLRVPSFRRASADDPLVTAGAGGPQSVCACPGASAPCTPCVCAPPTDDSAPGAGGRPDPNSRLCNRLTLQRSESSARLTGRRRGCSCRWW